MGCPLDVSSDIVSIPKRVSEALNLLMLADGL